MHVVRVQTTCRRCRAPARAHEICCFQTSRNGLASPKSRLTVHRPHHGPSAAWLGARPNLPPAAASPASCFPHHPPTPSCPTIPVLTSSFLSIFATSLLPYSSALCRHQVPRVFLTASRDFGFEGGPWGFSPRSTEKAVRRQHIE